MYCAHCGTQNDESAAQCRNCGSALAHDAPAQTTVLPGRLPTAPNQHWAVPDIVSTLLPGAAPQRRRQFWIAFIIGTAIMGIWGLQAQIFQGPQSNIPAMVFGAFYVPVMFIFFMTSEGLTEEPPALVIIEAFAGVALVGIFVAGLVNTFIPFDNVLVGFIEEGCKFLGVMWLLRRRKFVSIMDGILFGAAAGMGFAAVENLGYFFNAYQIGGLAGIMQYASQIHSLGDMQAVFNHFGLQNFWGIFILRSVLGPWMHGSWTAIIAGTAWRQSAGSKLRLDGRFWGTYLLVALMHTSWDLLAGTVLQWPYTIVIIGLDIYLLRGLILAAHRQERGEPIEAPPGTETPVAMLQQIQRAAGVRRAARFCSQCGAPLKDGAKFCASCGAPAGAIAASPAQAGGSGVPVTTS